MTAPSWAVTDDPEGQGLAFRVMGEAIAEIGLRQIEGPLTDADIQAVKFLVRNLLYWSGGADFCAALTEAGEYVRLHASPADKARA